MLYTNAVIKRTKELARERGVAHYIVVIQKKKKIVPSVGVYIDPKKVEIVYIAFP